MWVGESLQQNVHFLVFNFLVLFGIIQLPRIGMSKVPKGALWTNWPPKRSEKLHSRSRFDRNVHTITKCKVKALHFDPALHSQSAKPDGPERTFSFHFGASSVHNAHLLSQALGVNVSWYLNIDHTMILSPVLKVLPYVSNPFRGPPKGGGGGAWHLPCISSLWPCTQFHLDFTDYQVLRPYLTGSVEEF